MLALHLVRDSLIFLEKKPKSSTSRILATFPLEKISDFFQSICRVCMRQLKDGNAKCIYDGTNELHNQINYFSDIKVRMNDGLPPNICNECTNLLHGAIKFKLKSEESENKLNILSSKYKTLMALREQQRLAIVSRSPRPDSKVNLLHFTKPEYNALCDDDCENNGKIFKLASEEKFDKLESFQQGLIHDSSSEFTHKNSIITQNGNMLKEQCKPSYKFNRFVCEVCGKACSTKQGLKTHSLIHQGALPFQCPLCPHRARVPQSLAMHVRTHTKERPYRCPHCPATFTTSSNRTKHARLHIHPLPFTCDRCPKAYARKRDLMDHISGLHLGIKPHQCNFCPKSFATNSSLVHHRKVVHHIKRTYTGVGKVPEYFARQESAETEG